MRGHGTLTQLSNQIIPGHEAEKDTSTIKNFEFAIPKLWVYLPLLLKGRSQLQRMLAVDWGPVEGQNLGRLVLPLDSESLRAQCRDENTQNSEDAARRWRRRSVRVLVEEGGC